MVDEEALKQEREVLEALCPKEILAEIDAENKTLKDYRVLIYVISQLGFFESGFKLLMEYKQKMNSDVSLSDDEKEQEKRLKKEYIMRFLDNIRSNVLRTVFYKRVKEKL